MLSVFRHIEVFKIAEKIKEDIYWIGMDNPKGRDFHGISTPRGGSYNSYLVLDEKPAIIEGTNTGFLADFIESVKSVISPDKIQYLVIDHAEPDHAGALKGLCKAFINAKVVCNKKCKEFLSAAFGAECEFIVVKENDELPLGKRKIRFLMDPMVHWPETMMSYMAPDNILFSADLFGTEVGHERMFADEMDDFSTLTRDYFALIMRPFAMAVNKAIEKIEELKIDYLMPSHGPIYRKDISKIVDYYKRLSNAPEENKVLIAYESIWHSTEEMAHEIAKGVDEAGTKATVLELRSTNSVTIMAESLTSKAIALGSLTILGSCHPNFETILAFLSLNNQHGKKAATFGTHGWVPMGVPALKKKLEGIGYEVIDTVDYRFGPKSEMDYSRLRELGRKLAGGE